MTNTSSARDPWLPMVVIAMGQALMSFNVAAIPVSMGGMVESFGVPPTTVGTAVVMYSLGVSGFVLLGAKLGERFGSKIFFQASVAMFFAALLIVVFSPSAKFLLIGQALAGLSGAALVPTLVVLIANHVSFLDGFLFHPVLLLYHIGTAVHTLVEQEVLEVHTLWEELVHTVEWVEEVEASQFS